MPTTKNHGITYPSGSSVPNAPVAMQTLAESADRALDRATVTPVVICPGLNGQRLPRKDVLYPVMWPEASFVQAGMQHTAGTEFFTVPEDGIYQLNVRVALAQTSDTARARLQIYVNGINEARYDTDAVGAAGANARPHLTAQMQLAAGDVIHVRVLSSLKDDVGVWHLQSFFELMKTAAV